MVYVVPRQDAALDEAAVLAHCDSALSHAKRPKEAIFRESLPKTERGKMDRKALVAEWRDGRRAAAGA